MVAAGVVSGVSGGEESDMSTRLHPLLDGLLGTASVVSARACRDSGGTGGIGSTDAEDVEATDAARRDARAIGDLDVRLRGTTLLLAVSDSQSERVSLRDLLMASEGETDEIDDCEPL